MSYFFRVTLFLLLLLAGLAAFGIYRTLYKPLPDYGESIAINGLRQAVDIHWDPYGTPNIYAQNEEDLYFSIGYIHAQERLWQLTLSQIAAEGRFAEFLGEEFVPLDIHQRTLGFWQTAKRIEQEAPVHLLALLQRYADGINEYVERNRGNFPVEFALLGIEPILWTPAHSIAAARLMAWDQNVHWWSELTYASLGEELGESLLRQLIPVYGESFPGGTGSPVSDNTVAGALSFLGEERQLRSLLGKNGFPPGSNAWAVHGDKTESGLPILAGDPHMGLSIPGYWYEVYYHIPGHQIAGATIPGSPFVVLGQNRYLAWSMTNMMADDTDFFLEAADPENPERYVADSLITPVHYLNFETRREVIKVKGADDQLVEIRNTHNGPVISGVHPDSGMTEDRVVSMRWTGHDVSHELWALYQMNRATTIGEFEDAVREFHTPAMNFIYADRENNIALFAGASLPVRDYSAIAFRKGWDPSWQWYDTIPFEELPHVVNPDTGYVAHANNKMHSDEYPYYIATFWEPPSRIMRIRQLLETSTPLSSEEMQSIQYDVYSEHAREITELIIPILRSGPSPELFREALSYLENWNFMYEPSSTAASVFDLFFMNLTENVLKDELGEETYEAFIRLEHLPVLVISEMLRNDSSFFNRTGTSQQESRAEIVRQSMAQAIEQLRDRFGSEPFEWRWEKLHSLTLKPPLLGEMSEQPESPDVFKTIVNNLFNKGPLQTRGNGMTINKGQYSWHRPFEMDLGPSIRRIVDFSTPERSLSVLPTGQSGNPFSANYGDQTELWIEGRYRFIYQDSTFFQQTSYQSMTLRPD